MKNNKKKKQTQPPKHFGWRSAWVMLHLFLQMLFTHYIQFPPFSPKFVCSSLPAHLLQLCSLILFFLVSPSSVYTQPPVSPLCSCPMRQHFCKLHSLLNRICVLFLFFFPYHCTRKVSPRAIRDTHVNNRVSWKLQSWKFAASVFYFIWSGLVSRVSSCQKPWCSSCFMDTWNCLRVSVLWLKFLGE